MTSTLAFAAMTAVAVGLLRALFLTLMAGEIKCEFHARLEHRVRKAASELDDSIAADMEQEWLEELRALSDRPVRAFSFARGLGPAARTIMSEEPSRGASVHRDSPTDIIAVPRAEPAASVEAVSASSRLTFRVAQTVLLLALWVAIAACVVVTTGTTPTRVEDHLLIGLAVITTTAIAVVRSSNVVAALRCRPWLVLTLPAAQLAFVLALHESIAAPYIAFNLTLIILAVVVARTRTVWIGVALFMGGYAITAYQSGPSDSHNAAAATALVLSYPTVAALCLALRTIFVRTVELILLEPGSTDPPDAPRLIRER